MAGGESGLPRSTVVASSVAIALIGALTFSIVSWVNKRAAAAVLREEIATLDAAIDEQRRALVPERRKLEALRRQTDLFARGKLCISNPSSDARATIRRLAVVYLDDGGRFQTFNSDTVGGLRWTVEPGHRVFLDHEASGWDGAVTYYALLYSVGNQEFPLAEPWPLDVDHCVRLTLP